MKQSQKLDKIPFDKAQITQIVQLIFGELQLAQRVDITADFFDIRLQVNTLGAAFEAVFDLSPRKVMQCHLHHAELVQVCIE